MFRPLLSFACCAILTWLMLGGKLDAAEQEISISSPLFALSEEERDKQVESRTSATTLSWPAEQLTLAAAIELLNKSGNQTTLNPDVDANEKALVPALIGNYWDGVIAICNAFDLVAEPGEGMDRGEDTGRNSSRDNNGTAIATTGGTLRLTKRAAHRQKPIYVSCGVILAEIVDMHMRTRASKDTERTAEIEVTFRFEPKVKSSQIGITFAAWESIDDVLGRKLDWNESIKERQSDVALVSISSVPTPFDACVLKGDLLIQTLEPVTMSTKLQAGDSARSEVLGQEVSIELIAAGETTANGQRGPGINLSIPTSVLGTRPAVEITSKGQPVQINHQGSHWSGSRIELFYRLPKEEAEEYEISLNGQAALQQLRVPLVVKASLDQLSNTDKPLVGGLELQVPSRVSWPAGEIDLKSLITILNSDNQVLLELGADERRRATLEAFEGQFWEGILIICRAFDLTILPPTQAVEVNESRENQSANCVTGGPLCLGQMKDDRVGIDAYQANGIVLLGIDNVTLITDRGLTGVSRQAEIAYRLRLEPRIDANLIGDATISWMSLGGVADEKPLVVEEATVRERNDDERAQMRFMRVGRRLVPMTGARSQIDPQQASGLVRVSGIPTTTTDLQLQAQVSLQLRRPIRTEVAFKPGERTLAMLGDVSVLVRSAGDREDRFQRGTSRKGISVEANNDQLDALNLELRDADGQAVRSSSSGSSGSDGRTRLMWYFNNFDNGPYTVVLTAQQRMALLRLPFSLRTKTP